MLPLISVIYVSLFWIILHSPLPWENKILHTTHLEILAGTSKRFVYQEISLSSSSASAVLRLRGEMETSIPAKIKMIPAD